MLGLAVAVLVSRIGRTNGDTDREEREQRGDEIRPGVRRLRDQPEAVGRETGAELEPDQRECGENRPERGFPLSLHAGKPTAAGRWRPGSAGRAWPALPATLPAIYVRRRPARAAR
jgi:hypothetical protein